MPTDLACKPCKGTGWHPDRIARAGDPNTDPCPDCAGSGVAAWAVEAGASGSLDRMGKHEHTAKEWEMATEIATAVLAAVREEAKNQ